MKFVRIPLDDETLNEMQAICSYLHLSRNQYLLQAIDQHHRIQKKRWLNHQLARESILVRDTSMSVLQEFERIG